MLKNEVKRARLIRESYQEAIEKNSLQKPIGEPEF